MKKKLFNKKTLYSIDGIFFLFSCFVTVVLYIGFILLVESRPKTETTSQGFNIPVMSVAVEDKGFSLNKETKSILLGKNSLTLVMDKVGNIYYEDSGAFSKGNFYKIASLQGGVIDIEKLKKDLDKWEKYKESKNQGTKGQVTVFVADPSLPLEVVVNVVSDLRQANLISSVVLATDIMM